MQCDVDQLRKIVDDAAPQATNANESVDDDALSSYVRGHAAIREKLRGFICEAPTEWNSAHNDVRYAKLNEPDGFYGKQKSTNPDGYHDFLELLKKFQFWDKTGLSEDKLWFFHPLQFIRYFRRCGWLSADEMARCFPPKWLYLQGTQFAQSTTRWSTARSRAGEWVLAFNKGTRKYGISASRQRLAHFFCARRSRNGQSSLRQGTRRRARLVQPLLWSRPDSVDAPGELQALRRVSKISDGYCSRYVFPAWLGPECADCSQ